MLGAIHMEQRVSCNMVILFEGMRRMNGLLVLAHGFDASHRGGVSSRPLMQ